MATGIIISILVFVALGIISYIGASYAAKYDSAEALIGIYILFLTLAQFFAAKIAVFDFGIISWIAPVGVIVFPFTLQVTDMVNEKFGRKEVYKMIMIAFVSQVMMVFFLFISGIPELAFGDGDPLAAFAIVPRITVASWISFLISENFDAWIYDKVRTMINEKSKGEWWKYLWIRNVFSDILSLGLDTVIFIPLAFFGEPGFGTDTIIGMIIGQAFTKWILGLIDTPYMYLTRFIYDRHEKTAQE
ncbi:MAG: queuosine precursor transporter [Candidatus Hodarchaeales archaeon]